MNVGSSHWMPISKSLPALNDGRTKIGCSIDDALATLQVAPGFSVTYMGKVIF